MPKSPKMTVSKPAAVLGGLAALAMATSALAHHSFSMFDMTKPLVMEGTVKELAWTNPHISLLIHRNGIATDAETWNFEATSPGNLTRLGWSKRSFNPGDKVRISYFPLRNGQHGGAFVQGTVLSSGKTFKGR
jgi:hypothetical protein